MSTEPLPRYPYTHTGSFCVYHGPDRDAGHDVILLIARGHNEGLGVPGGYTEIGTRTEQPHEGAVRELHEEILMPDGSPALPGVTPDRLRIVGGGIDYAAGKPGTLHAGTTWYGYECRLQDHEIAALADHAARLSSDSAYAAAVREKSHGELETILLLSPQDLLKKLESGPDIFRYAHERSVAMKVAEALTGKSALP